MEARQEQLLKAIVDEYVKTAQPVGSSHLVEKYFPDLSPATIRNELAELESQGLIYQPHTSAGRIPTILGYQYYINYFVIDSHISAKDRQELSGLNLTKNHESIKTLAKQLAGLSEQTIIIAFSANDLYYTGLSHLFRQPEFTNLSLVCTMSDIIDNLDRVINWYFPQADEMPQILIGDTCPFGRDASAIIALAELSGQPLVISVLGPLRMDYKRNLGLIKHAQELINKIN
ncbi:MAG: hypothetical protein WC473_02680 [Patescibacteria group bacterium]|jgi:transcriptional regulator of heat shock response